MFFPGTVPWADAVAAQLWGFYNAAEPASEAYADGTQAWRK
jgi:hypothetical protein